MFKLEGNVDLEGSEKKFLEPGIYEGGSIASVTKGSKEDYNTKEEKSTVNIIFASAEGREHLHQYSEGADDDKTMNTVIGMLHIASRVMTEAELADFQKPLTKGLKTWEDIIDWYVAGMATAIVNKKVDFKVVGNSYNGNASTKIPYFGQKYNVPFIQATGSGKQLSFTKGELQENASYKKLINGEEAGGSTTAGAPVPPKGGLF